ncbi:MAG TPA: HK97 family phage prohead protease [Candidatus Paceibacterota bacterium]
MPQIEELSSRMLTTRAFTCEDIHVRDGDGRIVEAYAAVFNVRQEIRDHDGHYMENIDPHSFDRTIQLRHQPGKPSGFQVLFNHGADISGRTSGHLAMPIGVPVDVKADRKGVFTATRYLNNPLADSVLATIKGGGLRGQSFTGAMRRSVKTWQSGRESGDLPTITRREIEMREYGPAVFPAYVDAIITGTRAETFLAELLAQPPEHRLEWLSRYEGTYELPGTLSEDSPSNSADTRETTRLADGIARIRMTESIRAFKQRTNR